MKAQRTIAGIMILGSSLLVAWASGDIAFPAILCMLGMVGLQGRFTWGIRPERRYITPLLLLLLAVLFSIHCEFAHPPSDEVAAFAWQTIARYFLASMILILFLRLRERPEPPDAENRPWEPTLAPLSPSLGLFHLATAMASAQVLLLDDQYLAFRLIELISVTLVVIYASCAVRPPCRAPGAGRQESHSRFALHASCIVLLIAAVNLGWVGGSMLYSRVESLNLLPNWLWRTRMPTDVSALGIAQVGFSDSGRLGGMLTIMEDTNPDPVLRITSDASPGYLRGVGFEKYTRLGWENLSPWGVVWGERDRFLGRMSSFRLSEEEPTREMTVRHVSLVTDALFTPLGVCTIQAPFETLSRDEDDGAVRPPNRMRSSPTYRVAYTTSLRGKAPNSEQIRRMTGTPPQLHPRVRLLANRIFRNCNTTAEKIDAVTRHFRTNYAYALGLQIPPGEDPLTYFLLEASTGYCEYFATGAAILLRLVDVPTRYVAGFLVTERDESGKYWVARNMDAHAWVEAWDEENNTWVIVEATSQDALANNSLGDQWLGTGGGSRVLIARLVQAVYDYGLLGLLGWGWIFDVYSLHTAVALCLAFLGAAGSLALMRRKRKRLGVKTRKAASPPELLALHRMLATMDRRAKSAGVRREPHETLHAFADRLRGLSRPAANEERASAPSRRSQGGDGRFADWYLRYAGLRYCGAISRERLAELQELARKLRTRS